MFGDAFGGQRQPLQDAPEDIHINLECTLYELYNGAMKSINFERDVLLHDEKSYKKKAETLKIEVKPGYGEKTKLFYPSYGNERFGHKPSKLIVSVKEIADHSYIRKGDNLIYKHKVTLEQALQSEPVQIKTLDGRVLNVALDQMITP
jgi:DnaJ-class molecular chaperone